MSKNVVVITGAGSGLGASFARKYANLGYYVCLLGRNKEKLIRTSKTMTGDYSIYEIDVTSKEQVSRVFQSIEKEVGEIELLINNAGVGHFDLAENISEESIHQMIDINLKGTIFCTQEVLKNMKKRNSGTIANIISTAGKQGKLNESVYCASKFGVRGFTESLVVELQDTDIKAYAAYMGGMKTDFWNGIFSEERKSHLMEPDDVADIIMDNIKSRSKLTVAEITITNK